MKKYLLVLVLVVLWVCGKSQPASPFLRIEEGMHTGIATGIAADAAGNLILTCSWDKTARLWDAKNGHLLNIFRVPIADDEEGELYTCALSPDGHIAAVGGQTGTEWDETFCIYLFNTQTGEIVHRITGLQGGALDLKFSKDGKWLGAGLSAGGVNIYTTANWSLARSLTGYADEVHSIAFDENGSLATASYDGKIRLYDKNFEKIAEQGDLAGKHPGCLVFNPADALIAIAYDDVATLEVRSAPSLKILFHPLLKLVENNGYTPFKLAFSADGAELFAGGPYKILDKKISWKYAIRKWNNKGNGSFYNFDIAQDNICGVQPLPNGNVAILGIHPEIYVISTGGEILWGHSAPKNMYNYQQRDRSEIKIDTGGSKVGFTPYSQNPLVFNVMSRQLLQGRSDYNEPMRIASGTSVSVSKARKPIINSREARLDSGETVNGIDVSGNGKFVVVSSNFKLYEFNAAGTLLWKEPVLSEPFSVNISGNGKTVVAELSDGTIRWYSAADGQELVAFYLTAQNENHQRLWVLFTPSGYYDASAGAEDILGWHINNGPDIAPYFYSASTFREQYYRPDIIDAIFDTYDEKKAIELANSKIKRSVKASFDIKESLPPQVFIISPTYTDTISKEYVTIKYSVQTPANKPVTGLKVLIDGRPTRWDDGQRGATLESSGAYEISVKVPQSDCTVSLLAENQFGSSRAANVYLKFKVSAVATNQVEIKPKLYLLAVGINNYRGNQVNKLSYAAADARAFVDAMSKFKGTTYSDVEVRLLVDSAATRENIMYGLDWIHDSTSSPHDVAMIFFAGHGISPQPTTFYMLPYSADLKHLGATGVSSDQLKSTVSDIQGKVVVFIDACNSGKAMGSDGLTDISDMNLVINKLSNGANGVFAFSSCRSKEVAYEDGKWQHGAFTLALLEGIGGKCLLPGTADITPINLAAYLSQRVPELTEQRQHPTFVPPPNSPELNIGSVAVKKNL